MIMVSFFPSKKYNDVIIYLAFFILRIYNLFYARIYLFIFCSYWYIYLQVVSNLLQRTGHIRLSLNVPALSPELVIIYVVHWIFYKTIDGIQVQLPNGNYVTAEFIGVVHVTSSIIMCYICY